MKFFDRKVELKLLEQCRKQSLKRGVFTVMTGRRRIGKTSLLLHSMAKTPFLYLYISKDNEHLLVQRFQNEAAASLGLEVFGHLSSFAELFDQLMKYGLTHNYTLVIDEFQNLLRVNPAIPSHIQDIWDRYHEKVKVHLIACGSIQSMMRDIFENNDAPLYGRCDCRIVLKPFRIDVLKQILHTYYPAYQNEDLLCLYALTGGVAKYVAWLMDSETYTRDEMLKWATRMGSPYLTEGTELLMSEFGREYANYLSILQIIAGGMTSQNEIDSVIGKNTGTYLANLANNFGFIQKMQPMFAKPGGHNVRWCIGDCFFRFWFRFIISNQPLLETERNDLLLKLVLRDYEQFSGLTLEQYFRQKTFEQDNFTQVGSYWDGKGEHEIDMIALDDLQKRATIAEVKRNFHKINLSLLTEKAEYIQKHLNGYHICTMALSLNDM